MEASCTQAALSLRYPPIFPGKTHEECEQKLNDLIVEKYLDVVRDVHERIHACKSDPSILRKGFWDPIIYYRLSRDVGLDVSDLIENGNFFHGLPPEGFDHLEDESSFTLKKVGGYRIKDGWLPSEALKSVRESLCFIDCQEAIQVAYYELFLELFGKDKFNAFFKKELILEFDISETPFEVLCELNPLPNYQDMVKGDQIYYFNSEFYFYRHLRGTAGGHFCLCIEGGPAPKVATYGKSPDGYAHEEMYGVLVDDFNLEPIPLVSFLDESLAKLIYDEVNPSAMEEAKTISLTIEALKLEAQENPGHVGFEGSKWHLSMYKIQRLFEAFQISPNVTLEKFERFLHGQSLEELTSDSIFI